MCIINDIQLVIIYKKEVDKLPYDAKIISFKELKSIISPAKNATHTIVNSTVEKLLATLYERFEHNLYAYTHIAPDE